MKHLFKTFFTRSIFLYAFIFILIVGPSIFASIELMPQKRLDISSSFDQAAGIKISKGLYHVYENHDLKKGKILKLEFIILHAKNKNPSPYPLFLLAGGPGVAATVNAQGMKYSKILNDRDIVLVALRGTAGNNRLHIDLFGGEGIGGNIKSAFRLPLIKKGKEKLSKEFDLSQYSNPTAVDDLDEIREALGYSKINLIGGSGGTRVAMVYMKQHPESIRSAILNGVAPYDFKNPLYHASASHQSLTKLFKECRNNPLSNRVYPNLQKEFYQILDRLKNKPAIVEITHPETKKPVKVKLNRNNFAEAVRFMLYNLNSNRRLPYLIHKAYRGEYKPFAELTINNLRGLNQMLSLGLLLCVTCSEDVDRTTEDEILRETRGTFLGDVRIREQKAACDIWPRSKLPTDYSSPLRVNIPVLLLSGILDPVTPPKFAENLAKQLPNALHLVVPGAHGVGGKCLNDIQRKFLKNPSFKDLDTSCVKTIKLPPIFVPKKKD